MKPKSVYILRCREFVKVGIASDVQKRLASLQTGNPYRITLARSYDYLMNAEGTERAIHSRLKGQSKRGEWFRYSDNVLLTCDNVVSEVGRFADVPQRCRPSRLVIRLQA